MRRTEVVCAHSPLPRLPLPRLPLPRLRAVGHFTQFQRRIPYDAYDVTRLLRPGANTLSVLLGNGWYSAPSDNNFMPVLGYKPVGVRSLRVVCSVGLADGTQLRFGTGGEGSTWPWRHGAGALVVDQLFLGETVDNRLATPGWRLNDFNDTGWGFAAVAAAPPAPPDPVGPLTCPAGERVDYLEDRGDNGSCDCAEYCASDWGSSVRSNRPAWAGATSVSNFTDASGALTCVCVQGTHWCPRANQSWGCSGVCQHTGAAIPVPHNYCVSSTPGPPSPGPGQLEWMPVGTLTSFVSPEIRRHEPRSAVALRKSPSGSWVFDFGVNMAMQCSLRFESDGGLSGTTLRLKHAEQAAEDGSIVISNDLGGVEGRTTFILDGTAGDQTFETTFAYFGARFVDVEGWPGDRVPTADSLTCYFVHTALEQWSSIHFSSPAAPDTATILNGLHDMTMRSALSNFMSTPTDCPSREKRGWTGDGQAAAETLLYNFDMSAAYPKWLGDIAHGTQCNYHADRSSCSGEEDPFCRTGGDSAIVPEQAPLLFTGALDRCSGPGDPAWSSGYVALVDWVHRYYNDTVVLRQHYANADAYMQHLLQYVNTTASAGGSSLLDLSYPGTRYGDWVSAAGPVGSSLEARHTSNLINAFFWLKQLRIMHAAAETLGKPDDAATWANLADAGAASFNALYFSSSEGLYKDNDCPNTTVGSPVGAAGGGPKAITITITAPPCRSDQKDGYLSVQTAQSLPLYLGLPTTEAETKRVGDALAKDVRTGTYPGRTTTGLVGTKFVLSALVATGHADVALTIATAMEYPSWGRMLPASVHPLGAGEGTMWEQWVGDIHHGSGSRNHIMFGGFEGPYFFGDLAGIQNDGLGWDSITIAPAVAGNLTGVEATVGTLRGPIAVEWSSNSGGICGVGTEDGLKCTQPAVVNCSEASGGVIRTITFASYGAPSGSCGNWTSTCAAKSSMDVVRAACLGKPSCVVNATNAVFGGADPCPGVAKRLVIEATCSGIFEIKVSIPVSSTAAVRLPLLRNATAATATVRESGVPVWEAGAFNAGAAAGVANVYPDESLAGKVLVVEAASGAYTLQLEAT